MATGGVTSDAITVIPTGGPVRITLGAAPAPPSDSCSFLDLPCYRGLMPTVSSEPFEPDVAPPTPPVDTHGDTAGTATRVSSTSSTSGQIGPAGDVDYFQIAVSQAGTLTVETTGNLDTVGTLWQAGEEMARDDDSGDGHNFLLVAPVTAGTYEVAVRGYGASTGQYTVVVNFVVGALDIPGPETFRSGIGFISGWVCEAEQVELEIDGEAVLTIPYGTDREESLEPCGDRNNGFVLGMNWNLLGDGKHTVRVLADGLEFGTATLSVTTLGVEFLTGGQGDYLLSDFPDTGRQLRLVWQEAAQNFVIAPVSPPVESEPSAESPPTQSDPPVKSELPGALENPLAGSFQSGIGLVSGWVCGAEQVEIELDGTATFAAAYGASREDTAEVCDDSNTGFGLRLNWNELGDGEHTVRALADGKELGRATFTVTTLGETFLTGASGVYDLPDFPEPDTTVTVEWQEASQNFVIIEADGVERQSPDPVE